MCMFLWCCACKWIFIDIKQVKKDEKVCGDQKFKGVFQQSGYTQSIYDASKNERILEKEEKCKFWLDF